jgi:hypothetical protein
VHGRHFTFHNLLPGQLGNTINTHGTGSGYQGILQSFGGSGKVLKLSWFGCIHDTAVCCPFGKKKLVGLILCLSYTECVKRCFILYTSKSFLLLCVSEIIICKHWRQGGTRHLCSIYKVPDFCFFCIGKVDI